MKVQTHFYSHEVLLIYIYIYIYTYNWMILRPVVIFEIKGILLKDVFTIGYGCFPRLSLIKLNISIAPKTTESSK